MNSRTTRLLALLLTVSVCFLHSQVYSQIPPPSPEERETHEQIRQLIEKWRVAWQGKQLDDYISCYAPSFRQGKKDLKAWRKHKQFLNNKYKTIQVDVEEITIDLNNETANVQFFQTYRSDKYYEEGYKLLILTRDRERGWLIQQEIFLN